MNKMLEYLVTKVEANSVDMKKVMNQEETSVTGIVLIAGADGFLTKQMRKADYFSAIEDVLTNEQKQLIKEFKESEDV